MPCCTEFREILTDILQIQNCMDGKNNWINGYTYIKKRLLVGSV